jgi:uroporphyrinogen-III synthase
MAPANFEGLRVAAFESRLADQMARLIERYGGRPAVAPAIREIPLEDNLEVFRFGERLLAGQLNMLVLLTGVGTRTMIEMLQTRFPQEEILSALKPLTLLVRGPKPVAALREYGLTPSITVPEPNTWRDILAVLDARGLSLKGIRLAVQEYGVPNPDLLDGLRARGAEVLRVPIYRWALPEDLGPLTGLIKSILQGEIDVVLVTNAAQVDHVMQLIQEGTAGDVDAGRLHAALERVVVGSIGPTATERLRNHGWPVDLEPSHPKMGTLVREAAEQVLALRQRKRAG